MFNIIWDKKARDQIKKFDIFLAKRITKKIRELPINPFSKNVKRLKNSDYLRLRVGDYKIIFAIVNTKIRILKIGHRKNIYEGL